ncbi:MAG: 2-C-methyl-D-erythritol 4-phosphate cytidylyltransferase [Candidatus Saccharicenans sp.]|uniref:2-C-methyl-D-erythritol 4-phosphate cytidylyltransferase n=1 Tax=Candidatus Saccharicenans sp. TaxID=2819258 RepID=UPI00404A3151
MKTAAIILGGGQGNRLGFSTPKQFVRLGSRPLLDYSVEKFLVLRLDPIVAVLIEGYQKYYQPHPAISLVVPGGQTRQQSVLNGLRACPEDTELVVIHDAARPFFPLKSLEEGLALITEDKFDGLALAVPSVDTLVEVAGQQVISFPDRHKIFRTQTPQLFRFRLIKQAYEEWQNREFTDDLSLALAAGLRCGLINGSQMNLKITTEIDWLLAEQLLSSGGLESV